MSSKSPRAWQRMLSGRRLDLLDPSPVDIELEDIAHGLARVARWNGQTSGRFAFSVAQHCVLVTEITKALKPGIDAQIQKAALLHDGAEYVIGDIISPFKTAMGGDYKELEHRLLFAIHMRFELPGILPPKAQKLIKKADAYAAYIEAVHLAGFSAQEANQYFKKPEAALYDILDLNDLLSDWSPQKAQTRFKQMFHTI